MLSPAQDYVLSAYTFFKENSTLFTAKQEYSRPCATIKTELVSPALLLFTEFQFHKHLPFKKLLG